jgi:CubicO group peptidase (beta-lactamase class C family)
MKNVLMLVFCFSLTTLLGCSNDVVDSSGLDAAIQKIVAQGVMPGFAVSVVKNDKIAFQRAYGYADIDEKVAYSNQTTQPIGSVSKLMISVALMKGIEQGLFGLETPVNDILPFVVKNPNFPDDTIRIKHLVTHTSGILDDVKVYHGANAIMKGENLGTDVAKMMISAYQVKLNGEVLSLGDFLGAYFKLDGGLYKATNFSKNRAGVNYAYSNIGASLAAYIVEVKTGKSFEEYTKSQIFTPLGMGHTFWHLQDSMRAGAATLYWARKKPLPRYVSATYPDGGLNTNNEDLGKFLLAMMRGYGGDTSFMKASSFKMMFEKKLLPVPSNMNAKEDNYGVFWVWFKNGRIGHTGGDAGAVSIFAFYPDKKTGFLFMSNIDAEDGDESYKVSVQMQELFKAIKGFEKE